MKKYLKINIIILIILFILADLYCAYWIYIMYKPEYNVPGVKQPVPYFKPYLSKVFQPFTFINGFNALDSRYYDKKSDKTIVVFGCSIAEGAGLIPDSNLSALLSDATNYNVLNAGFGGLGIHTDYKLIHDYWQPYKIDEKIKTISNKDNKVSYFFYVYTIDHLRRLYEKNDTFSGQVYHQYRIKNNNLREVTSKNLLLYYSCLYKVINNYYMDKNMEQERKDYKLFNQIIYNLNKETKELYPESKFIIFVIPLKYKYGDPNYESSMFPEEELKKLKDIGVIVVEARTLTNIDLTDEKLYLADKCHPTSEYWKSLIPSIAKIIKNN